ncbi:hypothetical protein P7C73_g6872, partial [Tremellales sp. Uapishka_1]
MRETNDCSYQENPNEILVRPNTNVDEQVARAIGLLEDPHVLFIVIRTRTALATQRALEIKLGVTRFRHREGLADLHQYVIEEEPTALPRPNIPPPRGPKVINLDGPDPFAPRLPSHDSSLKPLQQWSPPPNIAIYLSQIELPDLSPAKRAASLKASRAASTSTNGGRTPSPGSVPLGVKSPDSSGGSSGSGDAKGNAGPPGTGVIPPKPTGLGKLFKR